MAVTIYVSGPMTGYENLNFPAFYEAEEKLKAKGYKVINPADVEQPIKEWTNCMKLDIIELMKADAVAVLPNWEQSRGARLEVHLALELGYKFGTVDEFLEVV